MADRPRGFGMTAELQAKKDAKRDPKLEKEAAEWIGNITGDEMSGSLHDYLKSGVTLCKLINVLSPGSVRKVNESKMAFKMMENIGNFLEACSAYGMNKLDMFQTVDLYEGQNIPLVTSTIHALGRKAQSKGYNGPTLGPKESQASKREFTEEQLRAGSNVIGLQMGTNKGASQAGQTAFGAGREVKDHRQ